MFRRLCLGVKCASDLLAYAETAGKAFVALPLRTWTYKLYDAVNAEFVEE